MIFNIRHYFGIFSCLIYALLLTASNSAYSVQIVRLNFDYNNTAHTMDIELYDDIAPLTVANYLDYVTSLDIDSLHKYDGTFIYRNIPEFILQTGGYTFRPPDPLIDSLISPINPNPVGLATVTNGLLSPVNNEFNLSNLRGTIAMAKVPAEFIEGGDCIVEGPGCTLVAGTGPDSATTEWFINLNDNSQLDSQNGGFTVFGSIIDDGMLIADEISTFPIRPYAGIALKNNSFNDLPVVNYNPIDSPDYDPLVLPAVLQEHLVMITTISSLVSRPILRFTPENVDFGLDVANDGSAKIINVIVKNTGNEVLNIDPINSAGLSAPFSITSENCSNTTLVPVSSSCSINYSFLPTTQGSYTGTLPITYSGALPSTTSYSVTANISGKGVPQSPVLNVSVTSIQFGDTSLNATSSEEILIIRNMGGDPLLLNSFAINGTDSNDYSITANTCISLLMDDTCTVNLSFSPIVAGVKTAILSVQSNGGNIDIPLNGLATIPEISVPSTLEIKAQTGFSTSQWILVTNSGTETLVINTAVISGPDAALFTQENNCPDTINVAQDIGNLDPNGICNFLIKYTPTTDATATATLTLTSNDPLNPSVNIILTGLTGNPDISAPSSFDVGTSQINGYSTKKELTITNNGSTALIITNILGLAATDFSQTNNCTGTGVSTAPNSSCSIFITFSTTLLGTQSTIMTLESNDPASPSINVTLNGFGDKDSDGVLSSIEASSLNSGDGNHDDIADDVQNNVATLVSLNSSYITFISDNSLVLDLATTLVDIRLISATPTDIPSNATFNYGLYSYSITLPAGDGVNLGILLPSGINPTKFYKYGPTTDNTTPHWYDFSFDAETGTGVILNNEIIDINGVAVEKNFVIVRYIDGLRGDDDLEVNGVVINNQSGLSFTQPVPDSGSFSYLSLLMIFIINILRCEIFQQGIRNIPNKKINN